MTFCVSLKASATQKPNKRNSWGLARIVLWNESMAHERDRPTLVYSKLPELASQSSRPPSSYSIRSWRNNGHWDQLQNDLDRLDDVQRKILAAVVHEWLR